MTTGWLEKPQHSLSQHATGHDHKRCVDVMRRSVKDGQGREVGVAGTVEELAQASLSSQPLSCFNWCADRAGLFCCGALDQCLRVGIVTGLPA